VTLQKLKIDPIVMQLYNIIGVFITCWLLQCFLPFNEYIVTGAGNRFQFPLLGLVAGVLFVVSVCSAIVGYKKIGIALLSGISCGCTILSSWLWGVVAFDEQPERIAASITAVIVLIAAVFIISFSREIASSRMNASICQRVTCFGATSQSITDDNVATSFSVALVTHAATSDTQSVNLNPHDSMLCSVSALPDNLAILEFEPFTKDWYRNVIRGCIWACVCGFAGGTGWVPLQYMPTSQLGLVFLPVFSVGCLFTSVLVLLVYYSVVLKFPRTSHLLNLGSASRDDKILGRAGLESLLTMLLTNQRQHPESAVRNHIRIIVEEKVDGANMGISINSSTGQIQVQNRSHYITANYHSQFAPLNKWLAEHSAELWTVLEPDRHVLYGEWLYATHSVRYDTLPGWFIAYDVFDRIAGSFLSRDQLTAMLAETSIPIVPLIAAVELSAPTSSASVSASAQAISIVDRLVTYVNGLSAFINSSNPSQNKREGVVIRICENEQVTHRCKLVRPDFICGNERWNKSHTLECNSLAEFNESSTDASA
jgi:glucose uptake protein GlcU